MEPEKTKQSDAIKPNVTPKVINLSSYELSPTQIEILKLGLKFTPTPKANPQELNLDIQEFCRKMRFAEFYFREDDESNDTECKPESIARNKSSNIPPKSSNKNLETFLDLLSNQPIYENSKTKRSNINRKEIKAIQDLKNNDKIIIKEADKGGAVVIMNKDFYENKLLEMLQDKNTYRPLDNNVDSKILSNLKKLIDNHSSNLTKDEIEYILHFDHKTSQFYGLPKIHKSSIIKMAVKEQSSEYVKITDPDDLKFRPIVAGPACPTHRLSYIVDKILQPMLKNIQSYIRDDLDFLNHIPETVTEDTLLVSFDVTSLYSNIPHELGRKALDFWLTKFSDDIDSRFKKDFILDSIQFILENNTFEFNNNSFIQILGTTMGTKFAPVYANLVLAFLEETLYKNVEDTYGKDFADKFRLTWKRYLDDCFLFWEQKQGDIGAIHKLLQDLHPKIKFTIETSSSELPFLDILLKKRGTEIITDIYHKSTDTKQYLHFKSSHERHTKINLPYSLARRICTIITNYDLRKTRLEELEISLLERGNPKKIIQNGIEKALNLDITTLRTPKVRQTDGNVIAFVSTHNPNNMEVFSKLHNNLDIIRQDKRLGQLLKKTKIIKSKRQPQNLKKILTSARFTTTTKIPTVSKCNDKRCGTCPYLKEGSMFTFENGQQFHVKSNLSCKSKNVVYVISCDNCNLTYIGQTTNLQNRITVHKQQIRDENLRHLKVSKHISTCGNGKFSVFPFYKIFNNHSNITTLLCQKERNFIDKYQPSLNRITTNP